MLVAALLWAGWQVNGLLGEITSPGAAVYQHLLADKTTACPLLFSAPEEAALCNATRNCMDHFSKELDYVTFKSLCDVIQAAAVELTEYRGGEDKKPGPAEVSKKKIEEGIMQCWGTI